MSDILGCFFTLFLLAIAGLIAFAIKRREARKRLESQVQDLQRGLQSVQKQIQVLNSQVEALQSHTKTELPSTASTPPEPAQTPEKKPSLQKPEPASASVPVPAPSPAQAIVPLPVPTSPAPEPVAIPETPRGEKEEKTPAPEWAPIPMPAALLKEDAPLPSQPGNQPPAPKPTINFQPIFHPVQENKPFDWEGLIGVKLFSWIAGVALLIAAVAFIRYSVDHGWLSPPVRLALGILMGTGLLVGCESKRAQSYAITAHALTAGGIAILFASFFAAHALWHLIPPAPTFLLLVLVAATAVTLSIRRQSIFIALLGLVGGFATPILLSTGQDRPVGLFSYLLLLNAGLAWVGYKKRWPILNGLSLGFTALYQLGWVMKFLAEAKLGLAAGIFMVFPLFAFASLALANRKEESPDIFSRISSFAGVPPLLLALHMAAVPAYGQHFWLLFGFLFLLAAGLACVAVFQGPEWLHLLGAASTLLVFAVYLGQSYDTSAWPGILVFAALFPVLYLGVPWLQARLKQKRPFETQARYAVFTAPLLLFIFPTLALLEPATAQPGLLFGVLLFLMALFAVHAIRFQEGFVHFTACFFVLAAEALWSSRHLNAENLLSALTIYLVFALFYLGVPILAQKKGKPLSPQGSGAILAFACLGLLFFLAVGSVAHLSLWTLALMLGILNLGLLYEASCGHHPILSILGMLLSWVLLACWWFAAPIVSMLVPALMVIAAFAMLAMGGSLWLQQQNADSKSLAFKPKGHYLGLVGHLFLLAVVTQPKLALPPWTWLAVLFVLNLAIGTTALYLRQGAIAIPAMAATPALLAVWQFSCGAKGDWMRLALWAPLAFSYLTLGLAELAKKRQAPLDAFIQAAGLSFLLSHLNLILFAAQSQEHYGPLLAAHVIAALGLLIVARRHNTQGWSMAMVLASGISMALWHGQVAWMPQGHYPAEKLAGLVLSLYLMPLAYPLLLSGRAKTERLPFFAAILSGAIAFFFFFFPSMQRA